MQGLGGAQDGAGAGAKSGMASLMCRAVQQAKAEAAVQRPAGTDQASHATDTWHTTDTQAAAEFNGNQGVDAMLQMAAQAEGAEAAVAKQLQKASLGPDQSMLQQAEPAGALEEPSQLQRQQQQNAADPYMLSGDAADLQAVDPSLFSPPTKTQSLGARLGSMLQRVLSPSRQSSYVPVAADSPPENEADESAEAETPGTSRRPLQSDKSLGERLGSVLQNALSIARQPSYTALSGDADFDLPEAGQDTHRHELATELSLPDSLLPRIDNTEHVLPRELSLRERCGSLPRTLATASQRGPAHMSLQQCLCHQADNERCLGMPAICLNGSHAPAHNLRQDLITALPGLDLAWGPASATSAQLLVLRVMLSCPDG